MLSELKPKGPKGCCGSDVQVALCAGRDAGWDSPPSSRVQVARGRAFSLVASAPREARPFSHHPNAPFFITKGPFLITRTPLSQASVERLSASLEERPRANGSKGETAPIPASTPWLPPSEEAHSLTPRSSAAHPLASRRVVQHPRSGLSAAEGVARAGRAREATLARLARTSAFLPPSSYLPRGDPQSPSGFSPLYAASPHALQGRVYGASPTTPGAASLVGATTPPEAPPPSALARLGVP